MTKDAPPLIEDLLNGHSAIEGGQGMKARTLAAKDLAKALRNDQLVGLRQAVVDFKKKYRNYDASVLLGELNSEWLRRGLDKPVPAEDPRITEVKEQVAAAQRQLESAQSLLEYLTR